MNFETNQKWNAIISAILFLNEVDFYGNVIMNTLFIIGVV